MTAGAGWTVAVLMAAAAIFAAMWRDPNIRSHAIRRYERLIFGAAFTALAICLIEWAGL